MGEYWDSFDCQIQCEELYGEEFFLEELELEEEEQASIAQSVEQQPVKLFVLGSSPSGGARIFSAGRQALKVTKTIGALVVEHPEGQLRYQGCVTPCGMRVIETARPAL